MRGHFFVLEGIDKSGKATQANLLKNWLMKKGFSVELVAFPDYSTPIGKEIKAFLAEKRSFSPEVRQLLYAANRWEYKQQFEKWLKDGRIIIADRYTPSGLAYGYANNLPLDWMICIEKGLPQPNIVILIDISPKISLKRMTLNKDRYEQDINFLNKVRSCYHLLAKKFDWYIIDGERTVGEVADSVQQIILKYLQHFNQ